MKNISILIITVTMFFNCCTVDKRNILTNNITTYEIKSSGNSFFNWDEYIENVELIPLEMTDQSAIGWFTDCVIDERGIYVFDDQYDHLLHFDSSGKFLRKIGQRGSGPGDYLEMRDFCISDKYVYTLDYKMIHCYEKNTGSHVESWSFKNENGFNPSKFVVFDKDNYYLWATSPNVFDKKNVKFYHMQEIRKGNVKAMYFKYDFDLSANPQFFPNGEHAYNLRPIDGDNVVYKLTKDSIFATYAIDFGNMSLSKKKVNELKNNPDPNAYLNSNAYKNISNVIEIKEYLYFQFIGSAVSYEGLINKHTGEIKIGRWNPKEVPFFLFTDGTFLYGYYDPSFLENRLEGEVMFNKCFGIINNTKIKSDDNCIIAKITLK